MRYLLYRVVFAFAGLCLHANAQTTVASGNWSNPSTWGGAPPMGTGTVIINHTVTLDLDYSHVSGAITINTSGALNGNSIMRVFALNYPSGTATLTINGSFNVARVALISNTVNNNGTLLADSLLNSSTLTNGSGKIINASQFKNNTGGTISNNGSVTAVNFLNIQGVTNSGSLTAFDFCNSKSFTNSGTGYMNITHDFSNIDTLASPAVFSNNGLVSVANNWHNGNQVNGSGKFCIGNYTWNSGTMSGTFDFCDKTGGAIDLNTGTIAGTVTYCSSSCTVGEEELLGISLVRIYPDPFRDKATVRTSGMMNNATLTVYNLFGQKLKQVNNISGPEVILYRDQIPAGLYFFTLEDVGQALTGKFIVD